MTITLTTDPILTLADVSALLEERDVVRATVLINSVSAQFLRYTGRIRINDTGASTSNDLTEYLEGLGGQYLWLHATPVTTITSIEILTFGTVIQTLTSSEYELYADAGCLLRNGGTWPDPGGERDIKVKYRAGWADGQIPGDIISGAIQQMRWERMRMDGKVGAESISRGGESVQLETRLIVESARDAWAPWRILT